VLVSEPPNQGSGASKPADFRTLADMLANIRGDLVTLRADVRADISAVRTDFRSDMATLRADWRADMSGLREEIRDNRREHRSDFRWLLGIMLAGFVGLAGMIAHGLHWL
jgi:hypothetical protein